MAKAKSTTGTVFAKDIPLVTTAPGTVVYDYKTGLADIKAGKKINFDGASGNMDYNQFHNVFGPYQLVKSNLSGTEQVVATISAAATREGHAQGIVSPAPPAGKRSVTPGWRLCQGDRRGRIVTITLDRG